MRNIVGNWNDWTWRQPMGTVTYGSLSHEAPPADAPPIKPSSPGSVFFFALSLKVNSWKSQFLPLPQGTPVQIYLAGNEDAYADTNKVSNWIKWQQHRGVFLHSKQLSLGAYHDVAGESKDFGGEDVRVDATKAAVSMIQLPAPKPAQ